MSQQRSLKSKTIGGLFWSFGEMIGNQGFQFLIQIILARLLLPEHFGLIGMVTVFIALSNSIINSGFTQALVREQHTTQQDYSTVFYFNMAVSLIIYLMLYVSAPFISEFFNEPALVSILRILSVVIIISAFGIIPRAIFTKDVNFKVQAKVNIAASVIAGAIAVVMAFGGFGVWSLIARTVATSLFQTIFLVMVKRWTPSLTFSVVSFKRLFGFGWKLLVSGLINTLYKNTYFLIIGKQYSATSLGLFTNAHKLSDLTTYTLTATIERVSYPVLSSIQDEEVRLKQAFRKVIKLSAFLIFPIMIGLAAIGAPLIQLVFGEQWIPMTIYFQILCIAGMLYPINALNLSLLQVKGRSDLFLYLELACLAVSTIMIFLVIWLKLGIIYLLVVVVLDSYVALWFAIYFSGKELDYPIKEQLKDLIPIYVISFVMGAVVLFEGNFISHGPVITLAVQVITGMTFYILSCWLMKIPELEYVYRLLVPVVKKIKLALMP